MTAGKRLAFDVIGPFPPERKRPACLGIPAIEPAAGAPECQQRAGDLSSGGQIGPVLGAVESGGGAICEEYRAP
ncbi:MAG TPA: hypothetical protein VF213_04450 [Dongiaceae bacterium]